MYKSIQDAFYAINSTSNIGCMSCLYHAYNPTSVEDFKRQYFENADDSSASPYTGRTVTYLQNQAKMMSNLCGRSKSECYQYMTYRMFEMTFNGMLKEKQAKEIIQSRGYTYEEPTSDEDIKLGIDFKVYKDGKLIAMIQVKPNTFFANTTYNQSLLNDRRKAVEKYYICKRLYKVPTLFMIYNQKEQRFIKHNNNYTWNLFYLVNNDGTIKNSICQR